MSKTLKTLFLAAIFSAAAPGVFADGYRSIARKLTKSSKHAGIKRIVILPFVHLNRAISAGTVAASERLTQRMGEEGKLEIIERQLLEKILSEESLRLTGALDTENSRGVGKILNADAVVSGTLLENKKGLVEIYARLVRIEDGKILATAETKVKKDWTDAEIPAAQMNEKKLSGIDVSHISIPHELYRSRCSRCHGMDGKGTGAPLDSLGTSQENLDLTKPSVTAKRDSNLASQIITGGRHMPAFGNLPGFKKELTNVEISELLAYIRVLGTNKRKKNESKPAIKSYGLRCAICHGEDGRGTHVAARLLNVEETRLDLTRKNLSDLNELRLGELLKKGKGRMPKIEGRVPDQEIAELLSYLKRLSKS